MSRFNEIACGTFQARLNDSYYAVLVTHPSENKHTLMITNVVTDQTHTYKFSDSRSSAMIKSNTKINGVLTEEHLYRKDIRCIIVDAENYCISLMRLVGIEIFTSNVEPQPSN